MMNSNEFAMWQAEYDPTWPVYRATPGQVVGRRVGEGVWVKTGECHAILRGIQIADGPVSRAFLAHRDSAWNPLAASGGKPPGTG